MPAMPTLQQFRYMMHPKAFHMNPKHQMLHLLDFRTRQEALERAQRGMAQIHFKNSLTTLDNSTII